LNPEIGRIRQIVFQFALMITFGQAMVEFEPGQGHAPAQIVESKRGFMQKVNGQ
jgi:hypothetical protein